MTTSEVGDAGDRLRRLLAVLAYLARVGEADLNDLAERFAIDKAILVRELELAACCGLPPYTPDQLLELVLDGDRVIAYGLEALRRPPRLTPDEGFSLAAAMRTMLAVPGVDAPPLTSALNKLEGALGDDAMSIELDHPEHLVATQSAAAWGVVIEIDYLGARRAEPTTRVVEPYAVVAREGRFYLDAYCRLAQDWRRFGVDRIIAIRELGDLVPSRVAPIELSGERAFAGGASAQRVRLEVPIEHERSLEALGAQKIERRDDILLVDIEVVDEYFLGRLLLRLGPRAVVISPEQLRGARAHTAERALDRYRSKR